MYNIEFQSKDINLNINNSNKFDYNNIDEENIELGEKILKANKEIPMMKSFHNYNIWRNLILKQPEILDNTLNINNEMKKNKRTQ